MQANYKGLLLFLIVVGLISFNIGCHPARQVASDDADIDQLKSKWIYEYVKDHPCPQLPEINLDSLCEGLGFTVTPETEPVKNTGDSVKPVQIKLPCSPQRILVPGPPDTRMLQLLNDSLGAVRLRLAYCEGKITEQKPVIIDCSKWKWNYWSWIVLAMGVLFILRTIIKFKYKISWL